MYWGLEVYDKRMTACFQFQLVMQERRDVMQDRRGSSDAVRQFGDHKAVLQPYCSGIHMALV